MLYSVRKRIYGKFSARLRKKEPFIIVLLFTFTLNVGKFNSFTVLNREKSNNSLHSLADFLMSFLELITTTFR